MSVLDAAGNLHDQQGRFAGHLQAEGDPAATLTVPARDGDPYVIVQGGLVDNNCALPVIDLDFMHSDTYNAGDFESDVLGPDGAIARLDALGAYGWRDRVVRWARENAEGYDDGFAQLSERLAEQTAALAPDPGSDPPGKHQYVVIDGGLVANDPALPYFDLDFMGDDLSDPEEFADQVLGEFGAIRGLHEAGAVTYRNDVMEWTQQRLDDFEPAMAESLRARLDAELHELGLA